MYGSNEIQHATKVLRAGGLVAIPTETVYGLAADAENPAAVLKIFAAKGRPSFHPLIAHIASVDALPQWAATVPDSAKRLAERFWPGPLTMILPRSERVPGVVTGDLPTVGLRVPAHPLAQSLLEEFGGGLAAPSANRFGRVSPTTAQHVREELGDRVDLILDGGPCQVGLESTIVDLSGERPVLLRPGAVTPEQLSAVLPNLELDPAESATHCSGRLESHYAPRASVQIVAQEELSERLAREIGRVAVLSAVQPTSTAEFDWSPMPADPVAYARQLYSRLREIDERQIPQALVVLPAEAGIGLAIADRVRKAAAPRSSAVPG